MDNDHFDAVTRALATPTARRTALRGVAMGGLLAALGVGRAATTGRSLAADGGTCTLAFTATVRLGPSTGHVLGKGVTQPGELRGELTFPLSPSGGIESGSLRLPDGTTFPVVGQATGRALDLRIKVGANQTLVAVGVGDQAISTCQGAVDGLGTGPQVGDLGDWHATANGLSGGSSTTSGGPATPTGNGATGASATATAAKTPATAATATTTGGACSSGVTCGPSATCCQGPAGATPSSARCQGDSCVCTYSCKAAGCAKADATTFFTIACTEQPAGHCVEFGCGTAPTAAPAPPCAKTGESCASAACCIGFCDQNNLCECVADGQECQHTGTGACCSGAPCTDAGVCPCASGQTSCSGNCVDTSQDTANCGACGTVCGQYQACANGVCTDTGGSGTGCAEGLTVCGPGVCADLTSNAANCGACGHSCPLGAVCTGGACVAP